MAKTSNHSVNNNSSKRPSPMITKAGYTKSGRRTARYGTKTGNK